MITEPWVVKWREICDKHWHKNQMVKWELIFLEFNDYVEAEDAAYQKAQEDMEAKAKKVCDKYEKTGKWE